VGFEPAIPAIEWPQTAYPPRLAPVHFVQYYCEIFITLFSHSYPINVLYFLFTVNNVLSFLTPSVCHCIPFPTFLLPCVCFERLHCLHIMTTSFISISLPFPNNFRTPLASKLFIQFPLFLVSTFTILFPLYSVFPISLSTVLIHCHTFFSLYSASIRHYYLLLSAPLFLSYQFYPRNTKPVLSKPSFICRECTYNLTQFLFRH